MAEDEKVVVFGEDVGALGGVFRVTDGLTQKFGEERCFDTPLAEASIMGTAIGMPFTAAEPRITAAVFGLFWGSEPMVETARRITVPVQFALQWDDEHIPRESGLALFDAFASKEKTLHANAGSHKELPRFEADGAVRFFARHLGGAVTSPA